MKADNMDAVKCQNFFITEIISACEVFLTGTLQEISVGISLVISLSDLKGS